MEYFELGCCFRSYNDLVEKLKKYCNESNTKFTTKDSRFITDENGTAKESLVYSELKIICVHGRSGKTKTVNRKRKLRVSKFERTDCPAYFRLKLINSGVALQIVAMNIKHNHPLDKIVEDEITKPKKKKTTVQKMRVLKKEIKSEEDSNSSEDIQDPDFIDVFVDPNDSAETESKADADASFTFRGLCAPVFTAFNKDKSINLEVISKYAKFLADTGIKGVLVHGTSGEGPSLSVAERKSVTEEWARAVKSTQQHLMVQVGGCPLPDVLELAKHAENTAVGSVLCLPELYFKPTTSSELIDYLKIVSEVAPRTPLFYYHIPSWSGVNINMAQFLNEAAGKIPTFRGIKYTCNDLDGGLAALKANNGKCTIFLGADTLLAGAFSMGFDSAIVTTLNIFPQFASNIVKAVKESNVTEAKKIQDKLSAACTAITKYGTWVSTMKAAMSLASPINVGLARPPLKNLTEAQLNEMRKLLRTVFEQGFN